MKCPILLTIFYRWHSSSVPYINHAQPTILPLFRSNARNISFVSFYGGNFTCALLYQNFNTLECHIALVNCECVHKPVSWQSSKGPGSYRCAGERLTTPHCVNSRVCKYNASTSIAALTINHNQIHKTPDVLSQTIDHCTLKL